MWMDFIWPNFEENVINSVLKLCGRHMKRLSFPNLMIPIGPLVQLSLQLLRMMIQCMKKLQYLDILWTSKNDIILAVLSKNLQSESNTLKMKIFCFLLNECSIKAYYPATYNKQMVSYDHGQEVEYQHQLIILATF